jgi:hypothetical protein
MFKAVGALLLAYAMYAILRGEVYAKAGPVGRIVARATSAGYYWTVVAIYALLALALMTVF